MVTGDKDDLGRHVKAVVVTVVVLVEATMKIDTFVKIQGIVHMKIEDIKQKRRRNQYMVSHSLTHLLTH